MGRLIVGTSGFTYKDWEGRFYPKGTGRKKLEYYSQHFNAVEINATFYRTMKSSVISGWYERTPDDFYFVLKAPRYITHMKKLVDCEDRVLSFVEQATLLGEKLYCILLQLPPSFKKDIGKLENFVKILPNTTKWAVEFRHKSWFDKDVYQLLNRHNIAFVIQSSPVFEPLDIRTADFSYIRFHGISNWYYHNYTPQEISGAAEIAKRHLKLGDVLAFFNNDYEAFGVYNAKTFINMVQKSTEI